MVAIRRAGVGDVGAVLSVWSEAEAEPTVTDDEDALRTLLGHAADALLVALDGKRVIGTLIVGWDGWRGSFYRLAVLPEWRRQGVARRLVAEGEAVLAGAGARRLAVFAVTSDPGAVPFWVALGYEAQSDRQRLVKNIDVSQAPRRHG